MQKFAVCHRIRIIFDRSAKAGRVAQQRDERDLVPALHIGQLVDDARDAVHKSRQPDAQGLDLRVRRAHRRDDAQKFADDRIRRAVLHRINDLAAREHRAVLHDCRFDRGAPEINADGFC